MSDPSEPSLGPAESRAAELLRLVGSQTPAVSSRFTIELVERARRQRAVAVPMRALGGLVAAIATALAAAIRSGRGPGRP
jgi:hypothetical protein